MRSIRSAEPHGDYYVVTHDVAHRLQKFRSRILAVPRRTDPMFAIFHSQLHAQVQLILPDVSVHTVDIGELGSRIWKKAGPRIRRSGNVVISTCAEVASATNTENYILDINRLFDAEGKMIGYGQRPGAILFSKQLDQLAEKVKGRSVTLVEEGAFTGGTIRFVLGTLKARGIEVSSIIIGFCTPSTEGAIREVFDGELLVVSEVGELVDWVTDHDLIPFTPGCGRVLGQKTSDGFEPIRTADGCTCAFPYILPFGRVEQWASLPADGASELSKFCLETAIAFFDRITKRDKQKVTIGDLMASCPTAPVPITMGDHAHIPPLGTEVGGFLKQARGKLD